MKRASRAAAAGVGLTLLLLLVGCASRKGLVGPRYRGQVTLKVRPADALVYLNGEKLGPVVDFAKTPFVVKEGINDIEIRRSGFFTERFKIEPEDRRIVIEVNLRKVYSGAESHPSGS